MQEWFSYTSEDALMREVEIQYPQQKKEIPEDDEDSEEEPPKKRKIQGREDDIALRFSREIYEYKLPHRAVAVYMYLSNRANKNKECFPSVRDDCRRSAFVQIHGISGVKRSGNRRIDYP